jgi:hypothetical protein
MSKPEFITNQNGNTLLAALQQVISDAPMSATPGLAEAPTAVGAISIATAFMSPAGFDAVAEQLEHAEHVRLLIGAEPEPEAVRYALRRLRKPGDPPQLVFERREVADGLKLLDAGLRRERDLQPFSAAAQKHLRRMVTMLKAGKLETRRYEKAFLHAKAVILDGFDPGLIAGSSNLTRAGLTTNLELNLARWDAAVFAEGKAWFDALWDKAVPFDVAAIFEEPEQEFPPWLIFLRILWQLYGEELEQEREEVGEIPLTAFQLHGVWRARRILKEFGGVIVADEVGLGKTFIGGAILEACAKNRQRALLVCPAALKPTWEKFLTAHNIGRFVEMVSYDQLARDQQFHDKRRPDATGTHLRSELDEYALVVVDEAHNYRSPDAPYRAAVLRHLLFGQRKDLVLLTATPVNNSLWDLFHLMRFFLRQDSALASRGIISVQDRFRAASKQDPANLSPDFLYPIIDSITVKRTRGFVKTYYAGDTIRGQDGILRPIVFPKAVPITVRYELDSMAPGLFDAVADALDPINGTNVITFARYAPDAFLLEIDEDEPEVTETASGLLRSGLLKRFESSSYAFRLSLNRMVAEHVTFLSALAKGKVITTAFLHEASDDDEGFDDLLQTSEHVSDATGYDVKSLHEAVERDHKILLDLANRLGAVGEAAETKLTAVIEELARIAAEAKVDAVAVGDEQRNRKVLLFSYFSDTVKWLRAALERRIEVDPRLIGYRGRIVGVAGSGLEGEEASRSQAVWGFTPESSEPPPGRGDDLYDLLITTDVLAEGMNLQQCRNILNYDLPWNPMRLVQRHGRIDRIGSPHPRVFLRTVFPADRLDALLALEARILRKLAQAVRTIGVATLPLNGGDAGEQVFSETRAEIEKLAQEDPTLFEQGGAAAAAQTGEEYRQRLRSAMQADKEAITELPGRAGSGMRKGKVSGVLFCAEVEMAEGRRTFLRFVPSDDDWKPLEESKRILREVGTCLRLIDCTEETARAMPGGLGDSVFEFWDVALKDIVTEWTELSDPKNLQPPVRRLNRQVAEFIRTHPPLDVDSDHVAKALDILESPWPRRDETLLRERFLGRSGQDSASSLHLTEWVLATGLERFEPPAPLPPIALSDVRLVCWMALERSTP